MFLTYCGPIITHYLIQLALFKIVIDFIVLGGKEIKIQKTAEISRYPKISRMTKMLRLALVAVIVLLLGASVWQGWNFYRGAPEEAVGETAAVAEHQAGARDLGTLAERFDRNLAEARAMNTQQRAVVGKIAGEMVSIPTGTFRMGDLSGAGRLNEQPVHSVTVPAFKLGKHEVTFAQWDACVTDGGCNGYTPGDAGWGRGNRPVINVSWDDAQSFIDWLNRKTGGNYRLPTEAEWEYAARAGTTTVYSWGNDIIGDRANCRFRGWDCGDSYEYTAPVGSFPANPWGLHDMHGNVWEWVQDCWNVSYEGAPTDGSAWMSGDCSQRVFRGGSWLDGTTSLHSAHRDGDYRTPRTYDTGFRLAQDE